MKHRPGRFISLLALCTLFSPAVASSVRAEETSDATNATDSTEAAEPEQATRELRELKSALEQNQPGSSWWSRLLGRS